MRAHVIEGGVIVNTIVVESLDFLPGLVDADKVGGSIGDGWDGSSVVPTVPKPPKPEPAKSEVQILRDALITKGVITPDDLKGK